MTAAHEARSGRMVNEALSKDRRSRKFTCGCKVGASMTRNDMVNGWLAMREVSWMFFNNRGFAPKLLKASGKKLEGIDEGRRALRRSVPV